MNKILLIFNLKTSVGGKEHIDHPTFKHKDYFNSDPALIWIECVLSESVGYKDVANY